MTYKQLLERLQTLTPEQLAMDASVYVHQFDEYIPLALFRFSGPDEDVLDEGHPLLETVGRRLCKRCGSNLIEDGLRFGRCEDETCPYSDHPQIWDYEKNAE